MVHFSELIHIQVKNSISATTITKFDNFLMVRSFYLEYKVVKKRLWCGCLYELICGLCAIFTTTDPRGRDWSGILLWSLRNKRYSGKPGARRLEWCAIAVVFGRLLFDGTCVV